MPGFVSDLKFFALACTRVVTEPKALAREVRFLFSPSSADYYEFLGDDVLESQDQRFGVSDKPLWLNLGYWRNARTYPEAAEALARRLGDAAALGPGDRVLDAGFGYGEQIALWLQGYGVEHVAGVNITPLHIRVAQERLAARGLAERVDLRQASATELPFEDTSFDKVVALESAFHFDTREDFFREAFRVLRPGGQLALADSAPAPDERTAGFIQHWNRKRWSIPEANVYSRDPYRQKLEEAGFAEAQVESIQKWVIPGIAKYKAARESGKSMSEAVINLSHEDIERCAGVENFHQSGAFSDYVIASATKP